MSKKTILIIIIILLAGTGYGVYVYTSKGDTSVGGVVRQVVSGQAAQAGGMTTNNLDGPGREFVTQLLAIQNIKFNLSIFADPVFMGLQDFSQEIQLQPIGRPNPFAPLNDSTRSALPGTVSEAVSNVSSGSSFSSTSTATGTAAAARATTSVSR